MREIFNRDALICTGLMLAVAIILIVAVRLTDNTEALATCQASHSLDVCELTLNP